MAGLHVNGNTVMAGGGGAGAGASAAGGGGGTKRVRDNTTTTIINNEERQSKKKSAVKPNKSTAAAATTASSNNNKKEPPMDATGLVFAQPELKPAPYFYYTDHSLEQDDDPLTPITAAGSVPTFPASELQHGFFHQLY